MQLSSGNAVGPQKGCANVATTLKPFNSEEGDKLSWQSGYLEESVMSQKLHARL